MIVEFIISKLIGAPAREKGQIGRQGGREREGVYDVYVVTSTLERYDGGGANEAPAKGIQIHPVSHSSGRNHPRS